MAEKKISFGFNKIKKPNLLPTNYAIKNKNDGIELIQEIEGQTIKIIGKEIVEEKPLVIPLKENTKTTKALAVLQRLKDTIEGADDPVPSETIPDAAAIKNQPQTLDERVVHELLTGANGANADESENQVFTVPVKADELVLDGAKESTLNDYEDIPITQFGMAMLRGMGLKDEEIKNAKLKDPELRPKGMGLGADKIAKPQKLLVAPALNEVLEIKKNAYVKILAGKHKDFYGQIEGLDDHAGRLFIKLALGDQRESLNEFMVQPVSKQEYSQYGKVINAAKYEEYKQKEERKLDVKNESDYPSGSGASYKVKNECRNEPGSSSSTSNADRYQNESSSSRRSRSRDRNNGDNQRNDDRRNDERRNDDRRNDDRRNDDRRNDDRRNDDRRNNDWRSSDRRDDNRRNNDGQSSDRRTDNRHMNDGRNDSDRNQSRPSGSSSVQPRREQRNKSEGSDYGSRRNSSESSDSNKSRHRSSHKKSKKKHKSKSRRDRSKSKSHSSAETKRHHKKKTKKSKKERSRSRDRR